LAERVKKKNQAVSKGRFLFGICGNYRHGKFIGGQLWFFGVKELAPNSYPVRKKISKDASRTGFH